MEIAIDKNGNARCCQGSRSRCSLGVLNNRDGIAQGKHGSKCCHHQMNIIPWLTEKGWWHLPCYQKYDQWRTIILHVHTSRNQDRIADPLDFFE